MGWRGALIERSGELDALESARRRAASGHGEVIVVEGPAGIGKSRLVEAVRGWGPEVEVLAATGGVLEREIPFGVARELLERRLLRAGEAERRTLLGGPAARAEEVLGMAEDSAPLGAPPAPAELGASLHCLFWLVVNLAEAAPLVVAVDDAHWADVASLHYLLYLARRIEGLPVLVVATARPGEGGLQQGPLSELASCATVIRPAPLSEAGVGELVGLAVGNPTPELVAACRRATGGNPFLLTELLAAIGPLASAEAALDAVRSAAPSSVAHSVLLRVGRLPPPASRLAVAAALLGEGAPLRHAAALAGVSAAEAEPAADALVAIRVLTGVHPLRFEHPLVAAAVAGDVSPAARARLHRRAAQLLHEEGAPPERVVPHLLEAAPGGEGWAVDTLRRAARAAVSRGAPEVAVRLLERALAEPLQGAQAQLLAELGRAQFTSGALGDCLATFERALEVATGPAERTQIRLAQVWALLATQGSAAGVRCLEQALAEAAGVDPQVTMRLEATLAMQYMFASQPHPVLERLERHRNVPGNTSAERFVLALLAQQSLRRDEPCEVTRRLAHRALADGSLLEEEFKHESGQSPTY